VAAELFLRLNGYVLNTTDADAVVVMLGVAAGHINENQFAGWLRKCAVRRSAQKPA
jgi:prophage maintenance system killer protein